MRNSAQLHYIYSENPFTFWLLLFNFLRYIASINGACTGTSLLEVEADATPAQQTFRIKITLKGIVKDKKNMSVFFKKQNHTYPRAIWYCSLAHLSEWS